MCGIAGYLSSTPSPEKAVLKRMTDAMTRRGPDADGHWLDARAGIGLGHRRLAVLDLTEAGAQPMHSACRRYVVAFNGEIYNHLAIRRQLEATGQAPSWKGHSDTETLLAAISAWGLPESLRRSRGMFALALWDREMQALLLARDRMGEKPLYYGKIGCAWVFGSNLDAILQAPGAQPKLDRAAILAYLEYGYVPESHCIYEGLKKVPPGSIVELSLELDKDMLCPFHQFADLVSQGLQTRKEEKGFGEEQLVDRLGNTLSEVIADQCITDVPLGSFLSGGIDSSLITALMQSQSPVQVRSFSIGFREVLYNEGRHAQSVARHLGTAHTEITLEQAEALDLVPRLAEVYDEPFADASQIPMTLLCREARNSVTVALSGDGGDEIFGGYNRHVLGPALWHHTARIPRTIRRLSASAASALQPMLMSENGLPQRAARSLRLPLTAADKAFRLAPSLAGARDFAAFYKAFATVFTDPNEVLAEPNIAAEMETPLPELQAGMSEAEQAMAWDTLTFLPGDILAKVDRAAMYASLETRAPFLDARVVEAAWALPLRLKISGGQGKIVLRQLLARHLPPTLFERPKQGFAIPLDKWLREDLRAWAAARLGRADLMALAGLDASAVENLWKQHQRRFANNGQKLWTIIMLLVWLEEKNASKGMFVVR